MNRALLALAIALFASACDGALPGPPGWTDDDDDDDDATPADLPELGQNAVEIRSPEWVLPAESEIIWCYYGTWEGGDVAIDKMDVFQHPMTHHILLKKIPDDDPTPDGTLVDCTQPTDQMSSYSVFVQGYLPPGDEPSDVTYEGGLVVRKWLDLPEGMGVRLDAGARYMIDAHYVNTSEEEITTQAIFRLNTVEQDEIEQWVGSFGHHAAELQLPPHEVTSRENTCAFEADMSVILVGAHMHNYGATYTVDWFKPDGSVRRLMDLDHWDLDFWTHPDVVQFEVGEIEVEAGDWFTTTCTWNNTTDEVLDYPDEMCSTFGVAVPLEVSFECFGGVINTP